MHSSGIATLSGGKSSEFIFHLVHELRAVLDLSHKWQRGKVFGGSVKFRDLRTLKTRKLSKRQA